jgi:type VI secretion system protein ImpA
MRGDLAGADLEFDERFIELDQAIADHEADFDAPLRKGQAPFDWARVARDCEILARETDDLRIAVWTLRAKAESEGLNGWCAGLSYILELLGKDNTLVFPQGDSELPTSTLHVTILSWLASPPSISLFKNLPLFKAHAWPVSALLPEFGGKALSSTDKTALDAALQDDADHPAKDQASVFELLGKARTHIEDISLRLDESGADGGIDLTELMSLVGHAAQKAGAFARSTATEANPATSEAEESAADRSNAQVLAGVERGLCLRSRDDVRIVLEALLRYYTENENGHPAPLFIQRLQRMVDMSFELLMRELFSESEALLTRLARPASK